MNEEECADNEDISSEHVDEQMGQKTIVVLLPMEWEKEEKGKQEVCYSRHNACLHEWFDSSLLQLEKRQKRKQVVWVFL